MDFDRHRRSVNRDGTGRSWRSRTNDQALAFWKPGSVAVVVVGLALAIAACGGTSNASTYWRANFTGGTSLYMSIVSNGDNVSGWAKYGDGTFQHYTGTKNSDGTFDVSAYAGDTLSISGNTMKATSDSGEGTSNWSEISESTFTGAGGPTGG